MLCIYNARLILEDRIADHGWVLVKDDLIDTVAQGVPPDRYERIDAEGDYLAPGFIDLHVHGGNGSEFLETTTDGFLAAADFHLAGGTTALCPTAATATYHHFDSFLQAWEGARSRSAVRLLPVHLEGPHLAPSKAGAQDPKWMSAPGTEQKDWILARAKNISQITIAPEVPGALPLIDAVTRAGVTMSAGHTNASDAEMRAAVAVGLTKVTHLFNAMSTATKRGLFRQAGALEFALSEEKIFCELVADGFHVSPTLLKLTYRAKGCERIALVTDCLAGGGLPEGSRFRIGSLPCKVGPGYCLLEDETALAGSLARMIDLVCTMTQQAEVPLFAAVRMASLTPATILGIDDRFGSIRSTKTADLLLFDDRFAVRRVWIGGKLVSDRYADGPGDQ
ncbi:MAG: N-acetylglucosamine-6-phosphate deacetylase [Verrucomicrobia bacterium]|nr:N-acetylglucosamine-6-phosphate deacetylase [Verrucomicrobiota bacterium]